MFQLNSLFYVLQKFCPETVKTSVKVNELVFYRLCKIFDSIYKTTYFIKNSPQYSSCLKHCTYSFAKWIYSLKYGINFRCNHKPGLQDFLNKRDAILKIEIVAQSGLIENEGRGSRRPSNKSKSGDFLRVHLEMAAIVWQNGKVGSSTCRTQSLNPFAFCWLV